MWERGIFPSGCVFGEQAAPGVPMCPHLLACKPCFSNFSGSGDGYWAPAVTSLRGVSASLSVCVLLLGALAEPCAPRLPRCLPLSRRRNEPGADLLGPPWRT